MYTKTRLVLFFILYVILAAILIYYFRPTVIGDDSFPYYSIRKYGEISAHANYSSWSVFSISVFLLAQLLNIFSKNNTLLTISTVTGEADTSMVRDALSQYDSWASVNLLPTSVWKVKFKCFCYYRLHQTNATDELQPSGVDLSLCTHVIAFGAGKFVNDTIAPLTQYQDKVLRTLVAAARDNGRTQVLFSVTDGFSRLVANSTNVVSVAYRARQFLQHYGLHGLDCDWEFPRWSPATERGEKQLYVALLESLSTALRLVQPAYLLTVALTAVQPMLDHSFDVPAIAQQVDYVLVMAYDYHIYHWYMPFTGHNSPLLPRAGEAGYLATLNAAASVAALLHRGLDRQQVVLGVPTYGRTWRLLAPRLHDVSSPAVSEGFGRGYVSYPTAAAFARSADGARTDDAAFAWRGYDWISYETPATAYNKTVWAIDERLGGVMTFNLNCDDWANNFPIHSAIKRAQHSYNWSTPRVNKGDQMP